MTKYLTILVGAVALSAVCALAQSPSVTSILPAPAKAETVNGEFTLTPATRILADKAYANEAQLLAAQLRTATG